MNEYSDKLAINIDIILNLIGGWCYCFDHMQLDPSTYHPHVRSYIYVSVLFSISITTSHSWLRSSVSFLVSNVLVTVGVYKHFNYVPAEYYIVVATTIVCFVISLYCIERYLRQIYLMYKNMKEMKTK